MNEEDDTFKSLLGNAHEGRFDIGEYPWLSAEDHGIIVHTKAHKCGCPDNRFCSECKPSRQNTNSN